MMKRVGALLACLVALSLVVAGCASGKSGKSDGGGSGGSGGGKTITIGEIPWDEDIAVTALWKKILEDKGYTVNVKQIADAGPTFVGLSKGDIDLYLDAWLPQTHKDYYDKYKNDLTDLGVWYDNAKLTIAVPDYVKAKSLEDLKGESGTFKKNIVGIEPGAGLTKATKEAMPAYGLDDWQLQTSSTPAMLSALKKATDTKQPIVVTLWRPHWAYAAYPLRDLEDPKGIMGKSEQLTALGRKDFKKDYPEVAKMMSKFKLSDEQLGSLENLVLQKNKDDHAKGVDEWLKANPDYVKTLG